MNLKGTSGLILRPTTSPLEHTSTKIDAYINISSAMPSSEAYFYSVLTIPTTSSVTNMTTNTSKTNKTANFLFIV